MFNPAQDSEVLFVAGFGPITRDSLFIGESLFLSGCAWVTFTRDGRE